MIAKFTMKPKEEFKPLNIELVFTTRESLVNFYSLMLNGVAKYIDIHGDKIDTDPIVFHEAVGYYIDGYYEECKTSLANLAGTLIV